MKNCLIIFTFLTLLCFTTSAQDLNRNENTNSIQSLLIDWDEIRGDWLYSSLVALSNNRPIPDRTFPEMLTPSQLLEFVPEDIRFRAIGLLNGNDAASSPFSMDNGMNILRMLRMNSSPDGIRTSWSFGEPHIITFDNKYYQNLQVGEFILAKSTHSTVEVQARFEELNGAASFITAVSMNVGGDLVSLYANNKPDDIEYSSLRINGEPVSIHNPVYYMQMGGTVSYNSGSYAIHWPSGESAIVELKDYQDKKFINIALKVYTEDDDLEYSGLTAESSGENWDERLNSSRVDPALSLFEYSLKINAEYYNTMEIRKPTRRIISNSNREAARKICEEAGVLSGDIEGCIFDYAHYEITPNVRPEFYSPTEFIALENLNEPIANTNETVGELYANDELPIEGERERSTDIDIPKTSSFFYLVLQIGSSILGSGSVIR
ncbi:MAG: VWD domain-containing protein [Crocinitomicaceae bacterium]|nr:VWD domain-containing protein [Crocinitomicaceae bacterium]